MSSPQGGWNFGWPVAIAIVTVTGGVLVLAAMNKLPSKILNIVEWTNSSSPPSPSSSENKLQTPNELDKKVVSPPAPLPISPPDNLKSDGCGEQLSSKLGQYKGESVIINSSTRRSGKVVIDINREANAPCRLIARVEEFDPLAGKGTLNGQFDPNLGQKVALIGSLSHQKQPKIWDVEINIQFISNNSIEGRSTWKPKSGIEDTKIYYEEFTATKSF